MPADKTAAKAAAEATAEPLAEARRCLDDLERALRATWGGGQNRGVENRAVENRSALDARRVRADLAHLRESLDLLGASTADAPPAQPHRDVIEIPDTPYDPAMWQDADDEGIGCRHHR